ncbi:MAG: AmmeMemoRadiSam system protein B [Phycisphaerales bacterium]|jgi:AmmeMemoRadiSam system protein B
MSDQGESGSAPAFTGEAHQNHPKLRPVRVVGMPMQTPDGEKSVMLGISDARQISPKMVGAHPAFQGVLGLMDGEHTLDAIVAEIGRGLESGMLEQFVAQLDDAGLIEGPVFDAMLEEVREAFDKSGTLPPGSTAQMADMLVMQEFGEETTEDQKKEHGGAKLAEALSKWIEEIKAQEGFRPLENLPAGIVGPHLDYARGWINYASVYAALEGLEAPDRVILLGTNHFGVSTGVCGCDKGYETPLGFVKLDTEFMAALTESLGTEGTERLFAERYDHENEHSIELHLPWIQHLFGTDVPVFGALIHDPAANNGESLDGNGLAMDPFIDAVKAAISRLGGRTLVVSSADLSHMGPSFGDQVNLVEEEGQGAETRNNTVNHDREMIKHLEEGRPEDLIGAMAWQQNPTRWCSVGNLVAGMRICEADRLSVLRYNAALDSQGQAMVSSVAAVWEKDA